jgi:excisionase family DNA binding protein
MLDDEMLTIDDLASYLKLKPQTIYKWAQSGKLPGAKFGKEWRFRRSSIERWIDSHVGEPEEKLLRNGGSLRKRRRGAGEAAKTVSVRKRSPKKTSRPTSHPRGPDSN